MNAEIVTFPIGVARGKKRCGMPKESDPRKSEVDAIIDSLPFHRKIKRGRSGSWWDVTPSGDYHMDEKEGERWAALFLPLLRFNVGAPALVWIVETMIKAGEMNGHEVGFLRGIARACTIGAALLATT